MSSPAQAEPPLTPEGRKVTLAAGILGLMFVISATLMVTTGWFLWRGEQLAPVYTRLPDGCDAVVLIDAPRAALADLARLARRPGLHPEAVRASQVAQQWLAKAVVLPGVDAEQSWAVCRKGSAWYAALPVQRGLDAQVLGATGEKWLTTWVQRDSPTPPALRWGLDQGRWAGRDGQGRATAAVRDASAEDAAMLQIAWLQADLPGAASTTTDAHALLDALQAAKSTLQQDKGVRESLERVGGGSLHLYLSAAALQGLVLPRLPTTGDLAAWREGIALFTWMGAALRADDEALEVHAHLGGTQRTTGFNKTYFDALGQLDAASALPIDVEKSAIFGHLRVPPRGWGLVAPFDPGALAATRHFSGDRGPAFKAWERLLAGDAVWRKDGDCTLLIAEIRPEAGPDLPADLPVAQGEPGCPTPIRKRIGNLLVSGTPDSVTKAQTWLSGGEAGTLQKASLDRDLRRLLNDTQGWRAQAGAGVAGILSGPVQLEWIWLDTGIAAGVRWTGP